MSVYVCVCVCVYVYACLYVCVCVYMCVYGQVSIMESYFYSQRLRTENRLLRQRIDNLEKVSNNNNNNNNNNNSINNITDTWNDTDTDKYEMVHVQLLPLVTYFVRLCSFCCVARVLLHTHTHTQ